MSFNIMSTDSDLDEANKSTNPTAFDNVISKADKRRPSLELLHYEKQSKRSNKSSNISKDRENNDIKDDKKYIEEESDNELELNDKECKFTHLTQHKPYLGTLHDLDDSHEYHADNKYIIRGYRIHFNTFKRVMRSLFMVHNETVNIWTHLVGVFLAITLLIVTFSSLVDVTKNSEPNSQNFIYNIYKQTTEKYGSVVHRFINDFIPDNMITKPEPKFAKGVNEGSGDYENKENNIPVWPLCAIFIGAMICMGFSSTFHLFCAHSKIVKQVFNRLDYSGIVVLIVCSTYAPYYYLFYCHFNYAIGFIIFINVYGLIIFGVLMIPQFDKSKYNKLKAILFVTFGLSAGLPIVFSLFKP